MLLQKLKRKMYYSILLSLVFGVTSDFYEKMCNSNYLSYSLDTSHINLDSFSLFIFNSASKEPKKVIEEIKKELKNISITEEELNRYKKVVTTNIIAVFDSVEYINDYINYMKIYYNELIPNHIDIINKVSLNDFNKYIQKIDFSISSELIIFPQE